MEAAAHGTGARCGQHAGRRRDRHGGDKTGGHTGRAEWEEVWEGRETRRKVLTSTDFTREATIKRAPFLGPGCLSPHPSTSFSYLLPPQLSLDPSEGLPLQAQTVQLLIMMKQLEPGSGSFQQLQAGVRTQEDPLLRDREEAASVLLPGLLTWPCGKSHASPSSLPPFLPSFMELGIVASRFQMETEGSCDSLLPQTGIQEVLPKDPRVRRCLYFQPRPGSPPTTHTTFSMARFFFQSLSSPGLFPAFILKRCHLKKKKRPSLFHLPSVPAKEVKSTNSCFLPKFRILGTLSSMSAENRREQGRRGGGRNRSAARKGIQRGKGEKRDSDSVGCWLFVITGI